MADALTQAEIARELLTRRRARGSLLAYAEAIDIPGAPVSDDPDDETFAPVESMLAAHHKLLLTKLKQTAATKHGRLMVFMPPGSAKSSYASVVFPSHFLGAAPNRRIILASYGDDLARKMGRRTRAIIKQPRYRGIWNVELSADSKAAEQFALTNGSEYMACGIMAGVTGNRAHGLIIDDPIKGRLEAGSEVTRQRTYDAYRDDLTTRLIPGGWIVLITTRWHMDDLAGRILPDEWAGESGIICCKDGFDWDVLCIPAKCERSDDPLGRAPGEYLWPEWFDRKHWAQFENSPMTWNALFQQRPVPMEGALFKPDQITLIDAIPAVNINYVRAWDFGATEGGGDPTAGVKLGKMPDGRTLIADLVHFQGGPDRVQEALKNTAALDGYACKIRIPQDPGQAGKAQVQLFTRLLAGYKITALPVTGDKITRAEGFAAQVNVGNVVMVRAWWNQLVLDELRMFPNGAHDDVVDSLSDGFAELQNVNVMNISSHTVAQFARRA